MNEVIMHEYADTAKLVAAAQELDFTKPQVAILKPYEETHTERQRKTYWMWLDDIVKQGGGTGNRYGLDEDFRNRFVKPTTYKRINGSEGSFIKSVSKLNKKELSELMNEVWVLAHEFGMSLKDPEGFHNAN